jgi:branched-chain amino acid transport system ATP-binding protein
MAELITQDLARHFGGLVALTGVDTEIHKDEIVGLIGPNGAGKTTYANCVSGMYLPSKGKVLFQGKDISAMQAFERCRIGIGRTFQLVRPLQELSLLENIMLGCMFGCGKSKKEAKKKGEELCEFMSLEKLERGVANLTALEIKKLEIARALATEPRLLFLDEVMAGLNGEETMQMIELVRRINSRGITIIIIEHVMKVISELTHRVIVLDWGQVIAKGPYSEVSNNPEVISAYLGEEE